MAAPSRQVSRKRFSAQQALLLLDKWNDDQDGDISTSSSSAGESDSSDSEGEAVAVPVAVGTRRHRVHEHSPTPTASTSSSTRSTAKLKAKKAKRGQIEKVVEPNPWVDVSTSVTDTPGQSFRFLPPRPSGVNANLDDSATPLNCLFTLLTPDVLDNIIRLINEYAAERKQQNTPARRRSVFGNLKPVTKSELLKLLSVLIAMGFNKRPSIKDYWSTFPADYTPWYHKMFARDRFEAIYHTMLHASETGSESKAKIEPFMNELIGKFQAAFYPFENVAIDEMVIRWKGRWKYKQYNAAKPKKYHIKTFGLCDSTTGYVHNILTYFGAETSYDPDLDPSSGQAEKVFEYLLRPLGPGHHVIADRYYTTYRLLDYLTNKNMYYTGTLNINRKNFPPQLKTLKLEHRESRWYRDDKPGILCVAWRDKKAKKPCILVSTKATVQHVTVTRKRGNEVTLPSLIHDYNMSMNGCDRVDQSVAYYGQFTRKTIKWWKRIFFWLLEICQVNSYILYCLTRTDPADKISLKRYKQMLLTALAEKAATLVPEDEEARVVGRPRAGPDIERLHRKRHLVGHVAQDRNCVVCSTSDKRRRTNFICTGCSAKPHLHPNDCFVKYHS